MSLWLLLCFLCVGLVIGLLSQQAPRIIQCNRVLSSLSIAMLLFAMGAKLAQERTLLCQRPTLFLLAAASSLLLTAAYFAVFMIVGACRGRRMQFQGGVSLSSHELLAVGKNAAYVAGGAAVWMLLPKGLTNSMPLAPMVDWILRGLLLFIGVDLGAELKHLNWKQLSPLLLLLPLGNILFTLLLGGLLGLLLGLCFKESLLVVSGMGWYSLSAVLLSERGMVLLSALAFTHNVLRELFAILTAPLAASVSPYLPICLGGATSMDVMLPFVQRYAGRTYTLVSFYSGLVCSLAVIPLLEVLTRAVK